jgi:muramoyltetrapeptide carboxypeptidase
VEKQRVRRLTAGDRVAVVAPAGAVPEAALAAGVARLRSWGLVVSLGAHVHDRHLRYLAGRDEDRAGDLATAWHDPDVRAVFAARGGYGTLRMLDHLDRSRLPGTLFVGSSDLTALHAVLPTVSLFGPMPATAPFADDPASVEHLRRSLFEPESTLTIGTGYEPVVGGRATGTLAGGTLSLLVSGAPPPPPGAIVLLEDVNEQPYRIDHFLTYLIRSGWLAPAAGVALGSWQRCGDPEAVREVLTDRLAPLGVPVGWQLGFGHCPGALTVPIGVTATLDAGAGTLTLDRPALT